MDKLTPAELDLLARIDAKEELRTFFFRKAKGLKWFDSLYDRGYFDPAGNTAPVPAKEEGYITVPSWPVTEYLVATSSELLVEENLAYAERFLGIIRAVTQDAIEKDFGNYRTWWQFSKIMQKIPVGLITSDDLTYIDYWLDDKYERGLVAEELGENWLDWLLEKPSEESKAIALGLLKILYKATFSTKIIGDSKRQEAAFRFDRSHAEKITKATASRSGQVLGQSAVQIFREELQRVLETIGNDSYSSMWRAAIEDHDQNHSADDVEDILVVGLRESLIAYIREVGEEAASVVAELLESQLNTLKRIAIYAIGQNYQQLCELIDGVLVEKYFDAYFRHEMWHLLHDCYPFFPTPAKQQVLDIIEQIVEKDDEDKPIPQATAYKKASWFAAVRNHDVVLKTLYQESVELAGAEPDHPDFTSYWSSGPVVCESPKTPEELLTMSMDKLAAYLGGYEDPGHFREPGLEGLVNALKAAIKATPLEFAPHLNMFASLDSAYVNGFIEAFSELWSDKKTLPWADVWLSLLNFCEAVLQCDVFWEGDNSEQRPAFFASRHWVVSSIARLIESGTKSDDHAFPPQLLEQAKGILLVLLEKQSGEEFKPESDAVSIAINSPRGRCLEALINLALRSCRLSDKVGSGHDDAWFSFQPIFNEELARPQSGEYEFITLLVSYLPNFLYMSRSWVLDNLSRMFDRDNYQQWLCAMQGYAYIGRVYQEFYGHLEANQHFIFALDDENIKDRVSEKIIQNIVIAYIYNYESAEKEGSLVWQLFDRGKYEELSQIIWFVWTLRKSDNELLYGKVMELWPRFFEVIDASSRDGRKLLSRLATWSVFISEVDDTNRDLVRHVAAFSEGDYSSNDLLESIARISLTQSREAFGIWQILLLGAAPDYPEVPIREALGNLVASGDQGRRDAYTIVDKYLKQGKERPTLWLQEIMS